MQHAETDAAVCGADGCGPAATAKLPAAGLGTRIDIVSDAICPWCFIGKRHLEAALRALGAAGIGFSVHWNPFQLNPDMPPGGVERASYRAAKFGSAERSAAIDARVSGAAEQAGLEFRLDRIQRTPNTIDAHRLIARAGALGVQDAAMEAVFSAYFLEGRDIGDHAVLADCAAQAGMDRQATATYLAGPENEAEMRAADRAAREAGVSGVPSFFLDGYFLFSGAMPAEQIAEALRRGRETLIRQAA
ncbi:MAG: DsbA family oxidoreductase [Rhodospirillales bacterium]|nr:DsbA family oxidoreductase [Rhodospirillales bacterium]